MFAADDGTNVDNWTMDEIMGVVHDFIQYANSLQTHDQADLAVDGQQPYMRQESHADQVEDDGWIDMASDQKSKPDDNWQLPQVKTRPRAPSHFAPTAKMTSTDLNDRKVILKVNDS